MTKATNFESKDIRTKDGSLKFGHIHQDQTKSSVMLQGQGALEYISIDQSGKTGRWITNRCRGRYQIKCGDEVKKGQPGFYLDAASGDIVIRTSGRIRMEAENVDIIANGSDNSNGVIHLKSNEEIILESKKVSFDAKEALNMLSNGNVQLSASNILKMYGSSMEKLTGAGKSLLGTTSFNTSIKV